MPKIEIPEDQIIASLDELSPSGRRAGFRRLLPGAAYLERAVERNGPRIAALARDRGLDWNSMSDDQRLQLVDDVLHEQDS